MNLDRAFDRHGNSTHSPSQSIQTIRTQHSPVSSSFLPLTTFFSFSSGSSLNAAALADTALTSPQSNKAHFLKKRMSPQGGEMTRNDRVTSRYQSARETTSYTSNPYCNAPQGPPEKEIYSCDTLSFPNNSSTQPRGGHCSPGQTSKSFLQVNFRDSRIEEYNVNKRRSPSFSITENCPIDRWKNIPAAASRERESPEQTNHGAVRGSSHYRQDNRQPQPTQENWQPHQNNLLPQQDYHSDLQVQTLDIYCDGQWTTESSTDQPPYSPSALRPLSQQRTPPPHWSDRPYQGFKSNRSFNYSATANIERNQSLKAREDHHPRYHPYRLSQPQVEYRDGPGTTASMVKKPYSRSLQEQGMCHPEWGFLDQHEQHQRQHQQIQSHPRSTYDPRKAVHSHLNEVMDQGRQQFKNYPLSMSTGPEDHGQAVSFKQSVSQHRLQSAPVDYDGRSNQRLSSDPPPPHDCIRKVSRLPFIADRVSDSVLVGIRSDTPHKVSQTPALSFKGGRQSSLSSLEHHPERSWPKAERAPQQQQQEQQHVIDTQESPQKVSTFRSAQHRNVMKAEPPTDLDHDRLMARYHSWGAREKRESPSESRDFDRGSLRQRLVNTDPTSTTTVNVRPSTVIKDTMSLSQTELRQESFEMNYVPSGHVLTNAFRTPLTDGEDFRYRDGVSHGMVRQDALIDRTKLRLVSPSDAHITHIDGLARREQYPPKHAVPPRLSADNVTTDLTSFTKADEGAEAVYREKVLGRQTWPSYLTPINVEPPAGRDAILPNHRAQAQKSAAIPTYTSSSSAPSPTLSSTSSLTNQQKSDDVTNVKPSTIPYNQEEDDVPCSISTPVASMATDPEISSSQFRSKLRVGQAGYYRQEDLQGLYREWAKTEDWMRRDPPTSLQHEGQLLYPRRDASRDGIVTKRGSHNGLYNLDSYQTSTNVNRSGVNKGKDEIRGLNNVVKAKQNSDRKGIRMSQNVKGKEKIRRLSLVVDDEVDYGGPTRLDHKVKEKDDYVNTSQCASELDSEDGSRLNYNSDFNEYGGLVKDGYSNKDNESDHSSDYSAEGIRGRASSDSNNPGGNVDRQIKGKERVDNFSQQFISAGLPVNKDGKAALGDGVRRRRRESKSHQCDVCQKRFSRPSQLRTHLFTHSGEKPHMCPLCHKLFNVASNLTRHVRTHGSTKRKSSRIGSIVFRSFGHGFQTKQAGNNNAATGETVSRTDGMMSRRASASASSQPPEKLRWMVAETPFSGSLAADRRTKVVKQQKKAEHELMSLYAKATLSSPKLGQQRPDPVSLAPVSVLDPITALVTTDNKVMSTASSATNAAVKTPNIMKMAVTSTLMTTTTAITTTTTVAAATSTALPSNEMSARNMNTDHSQIAT